MSPASQGNLEIERYVGSDLILSCAKVTHPNKNGKTRKPEGKLMFYGTAVKNKEDLYYYNGRKSYRMPNIFSSCACGNNLNVKPRTGHFEAADWTGMPLISVADTKKKNQQCRDRIQNRSLDDDSILRTPLSRLAIHTQGAPLILSGKRYNIRKNESRKNQVRGEDVIGRTNKYKDNHLHARVGTSDCLSVTSDESSGSGHSENCLPRIIKPRKRRKKDRKPSVLSTVKYEDSEINTTSKEKEACVKNTENLLEEVKVNFKCDIKPNPAVLRPLNSNGSQPDEVSEDESHGPKLHHTFEDVTESELPSYGYSPSSCQCHYCDPSGIWDAPSNFFPKQMEKSPELLTSPLNSPNPFQHFPHSDLVLRRSWSEPISDFQGKDFEKHIQESFSLLPFRSNSFSDSLTLQPKHFSEKIESRKIWDSSKKVQTVSSYGDVADIKNSEQNSTLSYSGQCLEVSTEIVTSPDGHRDIEIKFYSTSPPSS